MSIDISVFDKLLGEGEYLEWVGKSEPFKVAEGVYKSRLNIRWISCAAAAVILTVAYIISAMSGGQGVQVFVPVLTIGVPLFVAVRPMMDCSSLKKKVIYAVTNKRIMVYKSETDFVSMSLEDVGEVAIFDKGNGVGDMAFGHDAVSAPAHKLRYIALMPKTKLGNEVKVATGVVFYNISETKKIKSLLDKDTKVTEGIAS